MYTKQFLLLLALLALTGCAENTLETGYQYRPLSATPAERRAFYASPYSPESKVAEQDRSEQFRSRRPMANY